MLNTKLKGIFKNLHNVQYVNTSIMFTFIDSLAKHLAENGIRCPKCLFQFALTRYKLAKKIPINSFEFVIN